MRSEVNAVADSQVVFDSGRLPLPLRIACLLLAVVCLVLTGDLLWTRLIGRSLVFATPPKTPLGWFPALAAMTLLTLFFLQAWVGRKRIIWEPTHRQLIVEDRWLFGAVKTRLSQTDLVVVQVRSGRLMAGRWWDIYARHRSRGTRWLTRLYSEIEARTVAQRIAAAIERPLEEEAVTMER